MADKLWGGRFNKKTHPLVEEFTQSIRYDHRLLQYDLAGSLLHVAVLEKSGYLKSEEAKRISSGLEAIFRETQEKPFHPAYHPEDIHTYIQNELRQKVGSLALKLHTARSRNEQVIFAVKLYSRQAIKKLKKDIAGLISALFGLARKNKGMIIPGFTHLQHAQPVFLKDYLNAYIKMLERDDTRLDFIFKNIKMTMGAGALAGTPIPAAGYNLDARRFLKQMFGNIESFNLHAVSNALDAVSDRDFLLEIISASCLSAMHLSRLAEDLILWSTKEFDFIEIDESFCTGSSLMPQKRNADVLELIRGYAGRLYGNLIAVFTMMKGLPLAYNRDMQLDKEPLFDSLEILSKELNVLAELVKSISFNKDKINKHLQDESLYATDLVYYLVDKKIPFKEAHTIVGRLIRYSQDNAAAIKDMPPGLLKKFSGKFNKDEIIRLFSPGQAVKSKKSIKREKS